MQVIALIFYYKEWHVIPPPRGGGKVEILGYTIPLEIKNEVIPHPLGNQKWCYTPLPLDIKISEFFRSICDFQL